MPEQPKSLSRRAFLRSTALATPLIASAGTAATPKVASAASGRARDAMQVRVRAAERAAALGFPRHPTNGDEARHDPTWALYSKGLAHRANGEADASALRALLDALASKDPHKLEYVPLGGYIKLANPQAAFAFDLLGPDSHQLTMVAPPSFSSAE